jgi:hypothetical protein
MTLIFSAVGSTQTPQTVGSTYQSDPKGVAVVEAAIAALGGRTSWQQVGGATAEASISTPNVPVRTVNWTDDWSNGRVRLRRDANVGEPSQSSLVSSDTLRVHVLPNGKTENLHHDNGIATLALDEPAPALILSLSSKYACSFHPSKRHDPRIAPGQEDPDGVTITERCPDPFYPGGAAILTWVFSLESCMPKSVEAPVWDLLDQVILTQHIDFIVFQNVDGRLVPSQLRVRRPSGTVDQLAISKIAFVLSIPNQTFQLPK